MGQQSSKEQKNLKFCMKLSDEKKLMEEQMIEELNSN